MSWIMPKDSGETLKIFLQRPLWNLALKSEFGTWKLPKKLLAIQRQRIHKIVFCNFLPGVNPIPPPQTYTHSLMDFTAKIFVCNFELKKHRLSLKMCYRHTTFYVAGPHFFRAGQRLHWTERRVRQCTRWSVHMQIQLQTKTNPSDQS